MLMMNETIEASPVEAVKPPKETDLSKLNELFLLVQKSLDTQPEEDYFTGKIEIEGYMHWKNIDRIIDQAKQNLLNVAECILYINEQLEKGTAEMTLMQELHEVWTSTRKQIRAILNNDPIIEYAMDSTISKHHDDVHLTRLTWLRSLLKIAELELQKAKSHDDTGESSGIMIADAQKATKEGLARTRESGRIGSRT
jgi:hypothetical protein